MRAQCKAEQFQRLTKAGVQAAREVKLYVPLDNGRELVPNYVACQFDHDFTLMGDEECKRLLQYG